jgi:hypothetical protein
MNDEAIAFPKKNVNLVPKTARSGECNPKNSPMLAVHNATIKIIKAKTLADILGLPRCITNPRLPIRIAVIQISAEQIDISTAVLYLDKVESCH